MNSIPLSIRNLTTGYCNAGEEIIIASGVNATIDRGQLISLLGPNGAGKSTLIKTITGFIPSISGEVDILGENLSTLSPGELAKKLSVVLTERVDFQHLTVTDLVGLGRSPYTGFFGRLTQQDVEVVESAIAMVNMTPLKERAVSTLSDGERQKAMIARALAQDTPLIILDEPTAFLDYPGKVELMMLLRNLCRKKGVSVLLSTHDIELALLVSDRLWMLDRSHGFTSGVPEDMILTGNIEEYFSGSSLSFDHNTASFKVDFPLTHSITISGRGERLAMAARALRREGIDVKSSDDAELVVSDEAYIFRGKSYASVESLVSGVVKSL